jgi:hypothetical protein
MKMLWLSRNVSRGAPSLVVALCFFAVGCSPSPFKTTYPVTGTLFFDGKAPAGATVVFREVAPENPYRPNLAQGIVQSDGTFTLATYRDNDGAPVGEYQVTFFWMIKGNPPNRLPERYRDAETSGHRVRVEPKANSFSFVLER